MVSDLLIFEIFGILSEYERSNLPQRALYQLLMLIRDSAKNAAQGEFLDLELRRKRTVTVEDYLEMVRLKTGALFAAPAAAGALVGGASTEQVEVFYDFAERLGCAYQAQDDVLDAIGDEEKIGKPVLIDPNGQRNVVLIHALENGSRAEIAFLRRLMKKKTVSRAEARDARTSLQRLGSLIYGQELADRLADEARALLSPISPSRAKEALLELSYVAVKRYA